MLRFVNFDVVFQEVPDQVSLAFSISGCPNRCPGCHSPFLWGDAGNILDEKVLDGLLRRYAGEVTCVCFLGGDADPREVERLFFWIRKRWSGKLKTAWYSGREIFPENMDLSCLDYLKLGPYREDCGGLDKVSTNQRFYRVRGKEMEDITFRFWGGAPETACSDKIG